jgi:glycosyltransferase involved in cell wall biosynthesis
LPVKVLFLVQKEQRIILDRLYEGVAANCDCDLRWLASGEQADLRRYFKEQADASRYDRVLLLLRFKKMLRQPLFIRSIPNLVLLEHDAWQNYFPGKYQGKFSLHYRRLPAARVLCSGFQVAEKLRAEGADAVFVPKGYDQKLLFNTGGKRDIELGFIGSIESDGYQLRKQMLMDIQAAEPGFRILKTKSGEDYRNMLNRIRYFVSADAGMGESMVKNFEALACGCVLCAYSQGAAENQALGFRDMENLVLYRSADELGEKLALLRKDAAKAQAIAAAGQALVETEYSFGKIGKKIAEAMAPKLRENPPLGRLGRLRLFLKL